MERELVCQLIWSRCFIYRDRSKLNLLIDQITRIGVIYQHGKIPQSNLRLKKLIRTVAVFKIDGMQSRQEQE
jgi:hypothetical protein